MDTIFDKILSKDIPADIVYEDEAVVAFRDIQPQASLHVLVIPRHKIQRFAQLGEQDQAWVGQYFQSVAKVAKHLGLEEAGYRVVLNNGEEAGQTVDYLHAHILGGEKLGTFGS